MFWERSYPWGIQTCSRQDLLSRMVKEIKEGRNREGRARVFLVTPLQSLMTSLDLLFTPWSPLTQFVLLDPLLSLSRLTLLDSLAPVKGIKRDQKGQRESKGKEEGRQGQGSQCRSRLCMDETISKRWSRDGRGIERGSRKSRWTDQDYEDWHSWEKLAYFIKYFDCLRKMENWRLLSFTRIHKLLIMLIKRIHFQDYT